MTAARSSSIRCGRATSRSAARSPRRRAKIVDEWAASWRLGRTAACKSSTRTARVACLDRGLADLRAQLAVWSHGDPAIVEHAVKAAAALPAPDACASSTHAALTAAPLVARIAQIHALERSGKRKRRRCRSPSR